MRHQDKKVKQVANHHGDRLLEDSSKHLITWTPVTGVLMREKQEIAFRRSLFALCQRSWQVTNSSGEKAKSEQRIAIR
jgi:hypothetical protein